MSESDDDGSGARGERGPTRVPCLVTVLIALLVLVLGVSMLSSFAGGGRIVTSKIAFDRDDWIDADEHWWADPDRIRMCDDARRRHLQPGTRRDQVVARLGEPFATVRVSDGCELWYELGPHRTDNWWLVATFSADEVLVASKHGSFTPPPGAPR